MKTNITKCPKCHLNTVIYSVEEKEDAIETKIFKCFNDACNYQVMDILELNTKTK